MSKIRFPPTVVTTVDEIPVGFYMPWEKSMQPVLPPWYVECNGQLLNDSDSPLDGEYIPNINGVAKSKTGSIDNGSSTLSLFSTTRDLYLGALVDMGGIIPSGAKVIEIVDDTTLIIDMEATVTGMGTVVIGGNGPVFLAGNPVSGIWRPDQMQQITGGLSGSLFNAEGSGAFNTGALSSGIVGLGSTDRRAVSFNSAESPNARTGTETYPKHRATTYVIKIKSAQSIRLINGYTITGEEFGALSEVGSNIKATDRLAVFDPDGGIYKNVFLSRAISQGVEDIASGASLEAGSPRITNITTGASDRTVTLPDGSTLIPGDTFEIYKADDGDGKVTIERSGTDLIDGKESIDIFSQYNFAKVKWTGAFWSLVDYKCNGSNANGHFVRYANGVQVCWVIVNRTWDSYYTWTYPSAFESTTGMSVFAQQHARDDLARLGNIGQLTATNARCSVLNTSSLHSGDTGVASFWAIGYSA